MHDIILYVVVAIILIDIVVGWFPTKTKRMKTLSKIEDLEADIKNGLANGGIDLYQTRKQENYVFAKQSFKNGSWIVKLNNGEYIKLTNESFNVLFETTL